MENLTGTDSIMPYEADPDSGIVYGDRGQPAPRTGVSKLGSVYSSDSSHLLPEMPDPTVSPDDYGRLYDPIVASVVGQFWDRSANGIAKYGSTLADSPLTLKDFLNHAKEEAMDFALYLETLIQKQECLEKAITNLILFWALNDDSPESAEQLFGVAINELIRMTGYTPKRPKHQAIIDYFSQS